LLKFSSAKYKNIFQTRKIKDSMNVQKEKKSGRLVGIVDEM